MRVEKKREAEFRRRKGSTLKTILQTIWFLITSVGSYFVVNYLFEQDILSYTPFYRAGIPRAVPEWVILAILVLIAIIVMQFVFSLGFVLANPQSYRKAGTATSYSKNPNSGGEFDDF